MCLAGAICLIPVTWAASDRLPADIDSGLGYLYEFSDPATTTPFEAERLEKLMAFILTPKDESSSVAGRSGAFLDPLAYHEFTVTRALPFILEYIHHPVIPPHIFTLGALRFASWKEIDDFKPDSEHVTKRLDHLEAPLIIRGLEHQEIAPDPSFGAYYSYDLRRTLIGFRHRGHKVWLSLSRQDDKSGVGRKGYILDQENGWHYIYSGEKGIARTGLGWIDSYLYDGFSCRFYIQSDDMPDRVKVAVFMWLRAGWHGMNIVRYRHIRDGLERLGTTMRQIAEHPDLPPPARIEDVYRRIKGLPLDQLRQLNRRYMIALERNYGEKFTFPNHWFKKQVVSGDFINELTRPQLEAVVFLEYMKGALGLNPVTEPEILLSYLLIPEP